MNTKILILLLNILLSTITIADDHNHGMNHHIQDMPSTHGMLLFGSKKIYLSHLPMFHTPHDYQVLLEVNVPASIKQHYLKISQENPTQTIFTIVPETFVLPKLVSDKGSFMAQVFFGHFERGGTPIAEMVKIKIEKILYFKKFKKGALKPGAARYILIGNDSEQFLIHSIVSKPDFDQIAKIEILNKAFLNELKKTNHITLEFKDIENKTPLKENQIINHNDSVFKVLKSLYLEFGDLSF